MLLPMFGHSPQGVGRNDGGWRLLRYLRASLICCLQLLFESWMVRSNRRDTATTSSVCSLTQFSFAFR